MTGEIVLLGPEHYDAVIDLWRQAGLRIRPAGRDSRPEFVRQLVDGKQVVIGLVLEGEFIGVGLATSDGRKGWINRVAVAPAHRRRGHARRLISEAETHLRAAGLQVIGVLIEAWNEPSIRLFEAAGYANAGDEIVYLSKRPDEEA